MSAAPDEAGSTAGPAMHVETARPSIKQVQGARSRQEILDAAERLMGRHGYAATSIAALAKESGLPASSIYWHFGSKSGVLGAVMERGSRRFFEDRPRFEHLEGPLLRLRALLEGALGKAETHPQFFRLFFVLLLGAEGEHAQDEIVMRVRREGSSLLKRGLVTSYLPWGSDIAEAIGDELEHLVLALFDGLFLASEAAAERGEPGVPAGLLDQMVNALNSAALMIRDRA